MRIAALSILIVVPLASAQDSPPAPPVAAGPAGFFGRLQAAASAGDWPRVSGRLEDPSVVESGDLVVHPGLPNVSVPLSRAVALLVRSLPADGLRAIRESQDPTARLWFGEWRRTRDVSHLRRILRERFYSSLGPAVADVLATQARERGDLAEARRLWLLALENGIPDPTWPLLTAKAAQAMAAERRLDLVDRLADSMDPHWMEGTVIVDREPVKLRDLLRGLLSKDAPPGARMARQLLGDPSDGSTTGQAVIADHPDGPVLAVLNPGRSVALAFRLRPDADAEFLWSEALIGQRPRLPNVRTVLMEVPPDYLTGGDGVVVSSSLQPPYLLTAVEAATGKPMWKAGEAIDHLRTAWEGADLRASRPVFHSGRLYVPGLFGGGSASFEAFVAAFDMRTGDRRWATRVPLPVLAGTCPGLTVDRGKLYLGGQGGGLACLDQESGRLEWVSALDDGTDSAKVKAGPSTAVPVAPVVLDGTVVVPAGVGTGLVAASARTGAVLKSPGSSVFGRMRLRKLAVAGGRMVACGGDGWSLVDPLDKRPERSDRVRWFGIARGGIYAQCRDGDRERIVRFDPESGEETRVADVPAGTNFTGVATWQGRVILIEGRLAMTVSVCPDPDELMAVLRDLSPQGPADLEGVQAGPRRSVVGVIRLMWKRDGARALRSFEERAAGELDEADGEVRTLVEIAAKYPLTLPAGRALARLFKATRGSRELAVLRELTQETAEALPADGRRELRDAIEGILPDVDDREAGLLEKLSDWIRDLPPRN